MIDCRYKGKHKPMTQVLTNYNYPGVCFMKYAPGPADQPNRSNLTAWPAKKASTASDSPHPLLPYSSRMTIPPGTRSGKRYFSATSVGSYTSKSKLRSENRSPRFWSTNSGIVLTASPEISLNRCDKLSIFATDVISSMLLGRNRVRSSICFAELSLSSTICRSEENPEKVSKPITTFCE